MYWTYKTLALKDGRPEWLTAEFNFADAEYAAEAAKAYMLAHAQKGEMVVVSLEPSPLLKPAAERLKEHVRMLDMLKEVYAVEPTSRLQAFIREIDPDWSEGTEDGA